MIGFGTKDNTQLHSIENAFKSGYKLLDTKDSNKSIEHLKNIKFDRDKVMLCSKLMGENSPENHNPKNVFRECKKSLEKGQLSYWDIYYIHTTYSFKNYSILDTFEQIIKLKETGLIKNTGLSNITFEQLETFIINDSKPDYIQIEIHPYLIEEEIINLCIKNNIKIICHSPFGSNKLRKKIVEEPLLLELSNKYNKSVYQIILKWHINRNIIPIPSSNNKINIKNNLNLDFNISQEDIYSINSLNKNNRVYIKPNHFEYRFIKTNKKRLWLNCKNELSNDINNNELSNDIYTTIINNITLNGYYVCKLEDINDELLNIVKTVSSELKNVDLETIKSKLLGRDFQLSLCNKFEWHINNIKNNNFIKTIARKYFNTDDYKITGFISTNIKTASLLRTKTQLFHRDSQIDSLKIIIYLNDVNEYNGPVEIITPEYNDNLEWYIEHRVSSNVPRTTEYQIVKNKMNINKITGNEFTFIIFNGRQTHRGGYVQKGIRNSIYIELIKK